MSRKLFELADEIRAIAMTGLHYTDGDFDRERYERLVSLAALIGAAGAPGEAKALEAVFRADAGYITPKIDVRLAVFRRGDILLVREKSDGNWAMPGGYAEVGDSPSESATRETLEEAGVETRVRGLAGLFDCRLQPTAPAHLFHIYKLVFTGELLKADAAPCAGHEVEDAAFHPLDGLPELSLGRTLPLHIQEALRVAEDPRALPYLD